VSFDRNFENITGRKPISFHDKAGWSALRDVLLSFRFKLLMTHFYAVFYRLFYRLYGANNPDVSLDFRFTFTFVVRFVFMLCMHPVFGISQIT